MLGVRLLERDRRGAEPTMYGAALLKRGTTIFDELRESVKDIEFLADPAAGEVRIGCHHFLATGFVSAVIDRLSRRHPRIVFHIVASETATLHRELNDRNVDLLVAWRFGPFANAQVGFEFLFDDTFVVAAGARHPWVRRRRIDLAELANEAWALPPPESVLASIEIQAFPPRARLSSRDCIQRSRSGAAKPIGDRAFPYDCTGLGVEISHRARGTQDLALRTVVGPHADRSRHPEEPHA